MVDVYNRGPAYDRARARLDSWPIPPENLRAIMQYLQNEIDRKSPGRRYSDLWILKKIFVGTEKKGSECPPYITQPLSTLQLEDFQRIRQRMEREVRNKDTYERLACHLRNVYEEAFRDDPSRERLLHALFRTGRRSFFRWQSDTVVNQTIDAAKYYTFDEFKRLLRVAAYPRDRALLALAWEGTPRPNEYLSATVGDVEALQHGFRVRLHVSKSRGVTRHRFAYIMLFRADFNAFWKTHPFRSEPSAPLFYRHDTTSSYGHAITPAGANKMLKKLDRLSKIRKNGTLYFLRHGGYTWKRLQGMNPALAGKDMGWSPGGREERRYLHLTEEEVLTERLRLVDQAPPEQVKPPEAPICPFCKAINSPVDDRCSDCGRPLDMEETLAELKQLRHFEEDLVTRKIRAFFEQERLVAGASVDSRPEVVVEPRLLTSKDPHRR